MFKKVVLFLFLLGIFLLFAASGKSEASKSRAVIKDFISEIKNKNYEESYQFFSSELMEQVSLEVHVKAMKMLESEYGNIKNFSDKHPLFKTQILDENMFRKDTRTVFNFIVNYDLENLMFQIQVDQYNKIKSFVFWNLDKNTRGDFYQEIEELNVE